MSTGKLKIQMEKELMRPKFTCSLPHLLFEIEKLLLIFKSYHYTLSVRIPVNVTSLSRSVELQ